MRPSLIKVSAVSTAFANPSVSWWTCGRRDHRRSDALGGPRRDELPFRAGEAGCGEATVNTATRVRNRGRRPNRSPARPKTISRLQRWAP